MRCRVVASTAEISMETLTYLAGRRMTGRAAGGYQMGEPTQKGVAGAGAGGGKSLREKLHVSSPDLRRKDLEQGATQVYSKNIIPPPASTK